jgi:hypothetical protein
MTKSKGIHRHARIVAARPGTGERSARDELQARDQQRREAAERMRRAKVRLTRPADVPGV